MYLSNFEASRGSIEIFTLIASSELEISGGDPTAFIPLEDRVDTPAFVVAYFSYHLFIGMNMRVMHLKGSSLRNCLSDIHLSGEAVEKATRRLGIMGTQSETRNVWDMYKTRVFLCSEIMDESMKSEIDDICLVLKGLYLSELTYCGSVSQRLVDLWQYGQNIEFLLGQTYTGGAIDSTNSDVCLETSLKCGNNAFTEEYMDRLRAVRNFLRTASQRSLNDDEIFEMQTVLKWQSEHFLTCFCPHVFDDRWAQGGETSSTSLTREAYDAGQNDSDEEEKRDQPEKKVALNSLDLDENAKIPGDGKEVKIDKPGCQVKESVDETNREDMTSDRRPSSNQSLSSFSDTALLSCLKDILVSVQENSDLITLAVSVLDFLSDVEVQPSLCSSLD
jgi:hypothetical protein